MNADSRKVSAQQLLPQGIPFGLSSASGTSVVLCPLSSADEAQLEQGSAHRLIHRLARSLSITNPALPASIVLCAEALPVNQLPSTRLTCTDRLTQPAAGLSPLVPALGLSIACSPQCLARGPQGTRCPLAWSLVTFSFLLQRSYLYLSMTVRAAETPSPGPQPRLALWPSDTGYHDQTLI